MINTNLNKQYVPLDFLIPNTKEKSFFYQNGLSKVIPRLKLKVSSNIEDCFNLWNKFSQNKDIFDLWDLRYAWYQGYKCKPYFYTLYEKNQPLGVLPLWFDEDVNRYEWFGSWFMENNKILTLDNKLLDLFFEIAPSPIYLNSIDVPVPSSNDHTKYFSNLVPDDPKNIKDISHMRSMDDYLSVISKKHRYNLKSNYKKIKSLNPKVIITEGINERALQNMIRLNKIRFDGEVREESEFFEKGSDDVYRHMVKNSGLYKTKYIEVLIDGEVVAVDFVIEYKGVYYLLIGGSDISRFKGIGNFMLYLEIEDAIRNSSKLINCFQIDYGWKHRYFDQQDSYMFESSEKVL